MLWGNNSSGIAMNQKKSQSIKGGLGDKQQIYRKYQKLFEKKEGKLTGKQCDTN